jgi:hypothetical protein
VSSAVDTKGRGGREARLEFSVAFVRRTWDELVDPVTIIELLYGYESKPATYARGVGSELLDVERAIADAVAGDESAPGDVQEHLTEATEALTSSAAQ